MPNLIQKVIRVTRERYMGMLSGRRLLTRSPPIQVPAIVRRGAHPPNDTRDHARKASAPAAADWASAPWLWCRKTAGGVIRAR
jgi:hypothetical protein